MRFLMVMGFMLGMVQPVFAEDAPQLSLDQIKTMWHNCAVKNVKQVQSHTGMTNDPMIETVIHAAVDSCDKPQDMYLKAVEKQNPATSPTDALAAARMQIFLQVYNEFTGL